MKDPFKSGSVVLATRDPIDVYVAKERLLVYLGNFFWLSESMVPRQDSLFHSKMIRDFYSGHCKIL